MKKMFVKAMAVISAAAMMLTGCGAKDVSGEYEVKVNLVDYMTEDDKEGLAELEEMGATFFNDMTITMDLSMNSDKTFKMELDAEDLMEQVTEGFKTQGSDIVKAVLDAQGVTEDMYDMLFESMGVASMEEFEEYLVGTMVDSMDEAMEEMTDELEKTKVTGTYSVKGNQVLFTLDEAVDGMKFDQADIRADGSLKIKADEDGEKELIFVKKN